MPTAKNLNELFKMIQDKANSVLKNEIAELTIQEMQREIQETVYDVYDPVMYNRQMYDGGLIDRDNIEVEVVDDNTISVENIRFDGDRNVAEIVESGYGYNFEFPYNGIARPFTENTRIALRKSGKLKQKMREGLKKRGIDTT